MLDNVVKAIFAIWSMEVACLLTYAFLTPAAIWLLHKKHLKRIQLSQANDCDNKKLFGLSITTSRYLKWFALFVAMLSLILWICTAFSFSIGRYFDEICVGMEHTSPTFIAVQSFLFNPSMCVNLFVHLNFESIFLLWFCFTFSQITISGFVRLSIRKYQHQVWCSSIRHDH